MLLSNLIFSGILGPLAGATNIDAAACAERLKRSVPHAVTLDRIDRTLSNHSDVRPLYQSDDPDADLIVLVSRHAESRIRLVREIAGWLNLPVLTAGHPRPADLEDASPGLINAFIRTDDLDHENIKGMVTLTLMQSHFDFGGWANVPLRTLRDNVRLEYGGAEVSGEVLRRLAGIYYVGRAHEILEN